MRIFGMSIVTIIVIVAAFWIGTRNPGFFGALRGTVASVAS